MTDPASRPTLAAMADAMTLDVIGKRENLRICRERAAHCRWPAEDVARKAARLLLFEAIALDLRARAETEAAATRGAA